MTQVPLLDLVRQYAPIRHEVLGAIEEILDSGEFILGAKVDQLERQIAQRVGAEHAIGVSSGTDAILASLMALGIGPGDEVVTTPYTFFATAGCIARVGAKPVFVDIDRATFNIDPHLVERAISGRTKAIIPVHLFGQCAEMKPILAIAQQHGISVIEDAAQSLGAQYRDGRYAGTMGTLGCYSFFPSKNIGCMGDGGMVVTNDPDLAERIRVLRVHGAKPKYWHKLIGGNFRLDAIHAAVLSVNLQYLGQWTRQRQANAAAYDEVFRANSDGIVPPAAVYREVQGLPGFHVYNQYVIRTPQRDRLREALRCAGIGTGIYYPLSLHQQDCFAYLNYGAGDFPESARAAAESLALPVHPLLTAEEVRRIAQTVLSGVAAAV